MDCQRNVMTMISGQIVGFEYVLTGSQPIDLRMPFSKSKVIAENVIGNKTNKHEGDEKRQEHQGLRKFLKPLFTKFVQQNGNTNLQGVSKYNKS